MSNPISDPARLLTHTELAGTLAAVEAVADSAPHGDPEALKSAAAKLQAALSAPEDNTGVEKAVEEAVVAIDATFEYLASSGLMEEGGGLPMYEATKPLAEARANLAAIQPFLTQPEGDSDSEELTARQQVDDTLRLAALESAPHDYCVGPDLSLKERAWLRGRDDTVEYIRGKLSHLPDSLSHRSQPVPGDGEQEALNAFGEIASRLGRIRVYLNCEVGSPEIDVASALRDADEAAEYFDPVRAALRTLHQHSGDGEGSGVEGERFKKLRDALLSDEAVKAASTAAIHWRQEDDEIESVDFPAGLRAAWRAATGHEFDLAQCMCRSVPCCSGVTATHEASCPRFVPEALTQPAVSEVPEDAACTCAPKATAGTAHDPGCPFWRPESEVARVPGNSGERTARQIICERRQSCNEQIESLIAAAEKVKREPEKWVAEHRVRQYQDEIRVLRLIEEALPGNSGGVEEENSRLERERDEWKARYRRQKKARKHAQGQKRHWKRKHAQQVRRVQQIAEDLARVTAERNEQNRIVEDAQLPQPQLSDEDREGGGDREQLTMIALALKNMGIEDCTPEEGVEQLVTLLASYRSSQPQQPGCSALECETPGCTCFESSGQPNKERHVPGCLYRRAIEVLEKDGPEGWEGHPPGHHSGPLTAAEVESVSRVVEQLKGQQHGEVEEDKTARALLATAERLCHAYACEGNSCGPDTDREIRELRDVVAQQHVPTKGEDA